MIQKAKEQNYKVTLLYIWLNSPELAKQRVSDRVSNGGHNIPDDVIERRYYRGVSNLVKLFMPICDEWLVFNNSLGNLEPISSGGKEVAQEVINTEIWNIISKLADGKY